MYGIIYATKFKKDYKLSIKRNLDISLLQDVIIKLVNGITLSARYKDHDLQGDYLGYRECHIKPDWLLIYKIDDQEKTLSLVRTGTHNDLF